MAELNNLFRIILSSLGIVKVNDAQKFLKTKKDIENFEKTISVMKKHSISRKKIILEDKNELIIEIR
jgi:hypothetical protein